MSERPWATGFNRLLSERRGLAKGKLAELGHMRAPLISAVVNSGADPSLDTLRRIAAAFTKYDRLANPRAPEVEMWEFFVTDEQSALLRTKAEQHHALAQEEGIAARIEQRIMSKLAASIRNEITAELEPGAARKKA